MKPDDMCGALATTPAFPVGHDIGHGMWAHRRTCWLKNESPRHRPVWTIIRGSLNPVNTSVPVNLWFLGGLASLAAWIVLTFLVPSGTGVTHVLLGVGLVALVVWWGKRPPAPTPET